MPLPQLLSFDILAFNGGYPLGGSARHRRDPFVPIPHSLSPIPFFFKAFRTLLHSPKTQLFCFQAIPHSFTKTPGVGYPSSPNGLRQRNYRGGICLFLTPFFLASLLPETATPFPQRWGQLRKGRAVFRREDRVDCSAVAETNDEISCREAAAEVRPARH